MFITSLSLNCSAVQLDSSGSEDSGHAEHQDRTLHRHEQWGLPLHISKSTKGYTNFQTCPKTSYCVKDVCQRHHAVEAKYLRPPFILHFSKPNTVELKIVLITAIIFVVGLFLKVPLCSPVLHLFENTQYIFFYKIQNILTHNFFLWWHSFCFFFFCLMIPQKAF